MLARRSAVNEQKFQSFFVLLSAAQPLFVINKNSRTMISDQTKNTINDSLVGRAQRLKRYGRGRGNIPPNALKALSTTPLHEALMLIVFGLNC